MTTPPEFNLLTNPWIDVIDTGGTPSTVSMLELYRDAHRLRSLAFTDPAENAATMRLLVAFTYRATADPVTAETWQQLWSAGRFDPDQIGEYAATWQHRFYLAGNTPFGQTPTLTAVPKPLREVDIASSADKSVRLLHSRFTDDTRLQPAEAARWLLAINTFDIGGIKPADPADPAAKGGKVYGFKAAYAGMTSNLFAVGTNLFETLLLNVIPAEVTGRNPALDVPAWERPVPEPASNPNYAPAGPVDASTIGSRRILLRWTADGTVDAATVCAGDQLTNGLDNAHHLEPYTTWVWRTPAGSEDDPGSSKGVFRPATRGDILQPWRGIAQLLPVHTPGRGEIPVAVPLLIEWLATAVDAGIVKLPQLRFSRTVAVYDQRWTTIDDVISDQLAVPTAGLAYDQQWQAIIRSAIQAVLNAAREYGVLCRRVHQSPNGRVNPRFAARQQATGTDQAVRILDPIVRSWLAEIRPNTDPDDALRKLAAHTRRSLNEQADRILAALPPATWQRTGRHNPAAAHLAFLSARKRHLTF